MRTALLGWTATAILVGALFGAPLVSAEDRSVLVLVPSSADDRLEAGARGDRVLERETGRDRRGDPSGPGRGSS